MNKLNKVYEVITNYWKELHDECLVANPTRKAFTLGQQQCSSAYYSCSNGYDYALNQIELLVKGNPSSKQDINKLSHNELISMYQSNNLDFYETAIQFRNVRIEELNEQLKLNEDIKAIIEEFARALGWSLSYTKKAKTKSQKSVNEFTQYSTDQIAKVQAELKAKGLLNI